MLRGWRLFQCATVLWASRGAAQSTGPTQGELDNAVNDSINWMYVDHDYQGTRYSALSEINTRNVGQLVEVCVHTFPEKEPAQTAPIAYDGVIYATSAHYTVALDGPTCKVLWQHKWEPKGRETLNTQRGAAIKYGKLARGTGDGYLLALSMKDGKQLWAHEIAKSSEGYFISMAPLTVGDLVIVGPAGAEWAGKGWVGAFNVNDGTRIWKFNTVPEAWEPGAETWGNPAALKTGGGNTWTPMSYDFKTGRLFVPVGNPAPDFYDKQRPGANLYTNSLVVLDAISGKLAWYYQAIPHDVRDWDFTHAGPLFTATVGGQKREVIATTGKDGLLRLLDRDTHEVLYSVPFTTRANTTGPIDTTFERVCPGVLGGHEWNGSAYNPSLNILFVPATDWCTYIRQATQPPDYQKAREGKELYFGGEPKYEPWQTARGWLTAFDAATGKELWKYHAGKPMIGGVVATAGGLVFTGELDGNFVAFDARNGKLLYKNNVGGPIGGGLISFAAGKKQYVAVVSGYVGLYNTAAPELGGANPTITVFALR
jgi:PQQ-dependent dehydrogenase (methanol/ethanol family)